MSREDLRSPGDARLETEVATLVRTVRRQTTAIWVLVGVLLLAFAMPWLTYYLQRWQGPDPGGSAYLGDEGAYARPEEAFDNDFHARPVEEKIRRATAILVTRVEKTAVAPRELVAEIVKLKPGVRLYYKVGDEFERPSHLTSGACEDCGDRGRVVFMLGNPATMAYAVTFQGDRLAALGNLPLAEFRRLAGASPAERPD
jgi:hypothetical protein